MHNVLTRVLVTGGTGLIGSHIADRLVGTASAPHEIIVLDNFVRGKGLLVNLMGGVDWYPPRRASHHRREEVASWFEGNGVRAVRFVEVPGWEHSSFFVSGRKPR